MSDELERAVNSVLDAVPGADRDAVLDEFERYQTEFLMGPKAAVRSEYSAPPPVQWMMHRQPVRIRHRSRLSKYRVSLSLLMVTEM